MAEELVIMRDKQAVTTSLQVAESFGKKHYHIMDSIRKLTIENSIVEKMFVKGTDSKTGDYKVTKLTYNGQVWLDKFLQGNKKLSKYLK